MPKVIMQPSFGGRVWHANWKGPLDQDVPVSKHPYSADLPPADRTRLEALHPSGRARFWGSTKRQGSNYRKITTGDVVLFTGLKKVRAIGVVGVVLSNANFGDQMWVPHLTDRSWRNIYSLQGFEPAGIPDEDLSALDGFSNGDQL